MATALVNVGCIEPHQEENFPRLRYDGKRLLFEVGSVETTTTELEARGYRILVKNREEPWGRIVTYLISPEGPLLGVTFTP
jgi:hypothetical protein